MGPVLVLVGYMRVRDAGRHHVDELETGTHSTQGDLTPRDIIVQGNVVTGIIDWENRAASSPGLPNMLLL